MTTERFEAPLERIRLVEAGVTEPVRRTASGQLDYDYYLTRSRRLPAKEFNRKAQHVWRAIRRFVVHFKTHIKLKGNINKRPASVGEH